MAKTYAQAKGKEGNERYVLLQKYVVTCPAYRSLSGDAVKLYIELKWRYYGYNNGDIGLSLREAAEVINSVPNTARKYLQELEDKGFIKTNIKGVFRVKIRHSTTYILTEERYENQSPTKEFMKWKPEA